MDEFYEEYKLKGRYPKYYEMKINFDPTYKRESFSNGNYLNKNDQCPSYTDRVVFKSNDESSII